MSNTFPYRGKRKKRWLFDNLDTDDIWLNSKQASEYLGISTQTLMNLCSRGEVTYYKFGRRNRYKLADLRSLLQIERRGYGI